MFDVFARQSNKGVVEIDLRLPTSMFRALVEPMICRRCIGLAIFESDETRSEIGASRS